MTPIEGMLCLVTIKYADEFHAEFVNCLKQSDGRWCLYIPANDYPTMECHLVEYDPIDQTAVRASNHPEFEFVCDEVVDLDAWEIMPSSEGRD